MIPLHRAICGATYLATRLRSPPCVVTQTCIPCLPTSRNACPRNVHSVASAAGQPFSGSAQILLAPVSAQTATERARVARQLLGPHALGNPKTQHQIPADCRRLMVSGCDTLTAAKLIPMPFSRPISAGEIPWLVAIESRTYQPFPRGRVGCNTSVTESHQIARRQRQTTRRLSPWA